MSMLEAALHYALELGRPVFPLAPRGKVPIIQKGLRRATTREQAIRHWWEKTPNANVGLRCGYGLLVLDIDGPEGAASLRALEKKYEKLPRTVEGVTARGRHLHFAYNLKAPVPPSVNALGEKIDVRADGSYIVAPPSVHPSGFVYRWRRGREPGEHELVEAPKWLLGLARAASARAPAVTGKEAPNTEQQELVPVTDRSRSGVDFRLALKLLNEGADAETIADELRRTSKKYRERDRGEYYIAQLIGRAHEIRAKHTPEMRVRKATLHRLPALFGRAERTHIELALESDDGEIATAVLVVPRADDAPSAALWRACLSDVAPTPLLAEWSSAKDAWSAIRWKHRRFEVAVREGAVRWIRAVG